MAAHRGGGGPGGSSGGVMPVIELGCLLPTMPTNAVCLAALRGHAQEKGCAGQTQLSLCQLQLQKQHSKHSLYCRGNLCTYGKTHLVVPLPRRATRCVACKAGRAGLQRTTAPSTHQLHLCIPGPHARQRRLPHTPLCMWHACGKGTHPANTRVAQCHVLPLRSSARTWRNRIFKFYPGSTACLPMTYERPERVGTGADSLASR